MTTTTQRGSNIKKGLMILKESGTKFNQIFIPLNSFCRIITRANTGFEEFSFTGCLRNIIFADYIIDLNDQSEDLAGYSGIQTCTSCVGDPCRPNGNCIAYPDMTFRCACLENFVTDLCEFRGNLASNI